MYMKGEALQWLQAYMKGKIEWPAWEEFCTVVCVRFGVASKMKLVAKWRNVVQMGTVLEYQQDIVKIKAKVACSEEVVVEMFIGGWKEEIRHDKFKPANWSQSRSVAPAPFSNTSLRFPRIPPFNKKNNALLSSITPQPSRNKSIKALSKKQLEENKAKGLCFWCDKQFVLGHKCPKKKLFNIEVILFEEEEMDIAEVVRIVGKRSLMILIDFGSTHNFLDSKFAQELGCTLEDVKQFQVSMANGSQLSSSRRGVNFTWKMQGLEFQSEMLLLPLGEYDVILGIQWLKPLGKVLWDFQSKTLGFTYKEKPMVLHAAPKPHIKWVDNDKMLETIQKATDSNKEKPMVLHAAPKPHKWVDNDKMLETIQKATDSSKVKLFMVQSLNKGACGVQLSRVETNDDPHLRQLLKVYFDVFEEPKELPPHRVQDHSIPLKGGIEPINVRPYRYPNIQKQVMEQLVQEMLQRGGKENTMADALSRVPSTQITSLAISTVDTSLFSEIQQSWQADEEVIRACSAPLTELLAFSIGKPLPILDKVWEDISMDFIEGLPPSQGRTIIMVVFDRLSKYAHFVALAHPYTASKVVELFVQNIKRLHRMLKSVISDQDTAFTSVFWRELFRLCQITLRMSSAYHLQTNGQTEVVNHCLETYLRSMCGIRPKEWVQWLPLAERWYNTNFHTTFKATPFEVLYGQAPPFHIPHIPGDSRIAGVDRSLQAREAAYLKLQPCQQLSLLQQKQHKLSPRVHNVFHVSLLKKKVGEATIVIPLPSLLLDALPVYEPEVVLDRTIKADNNKPQTMWLIKWKGRGIEEASWESVDDIQLRFPSFHP
ncbi:hypothetical protein SLEP1_g30075 [Rubroshorea leprosula]|uniref:Uncharacterized protein n=1 Tax=Rubroshorea leprosula TaxID=152421 RepID=A0AAV5K966_9ROSI|nr:hypothetical protein SLEP1_g30075 [Rubroshorea leprosula]